MKYKHIKIDMDYCADPLWVSTDGFAFVDDSLSEYEGRLSKQLLHGLEVYQTLWEKSNWSSYLGPSDDKSDIGFEDSLFELLEEMEIKLAVRLKEELPDYHIYYCRYNPKKESGFRYEVIEITHDKPQGIYPTMVG